MEPIILSEEAKAKEALLKNSIQKLADQHGISEIKYQTSFTERPHFFLETKVDDAIKQQALDIYEKIFAPFEL